MHGGRKRKVLLTGVVVATVAALVGLGTFAAFTATTTNSGNRIQSGSVKIDQHSGSTTLYDVSNQKPGDSAVGCVRVTYGGSLASSVRLYVSSGITNGSLYTLKVERGSGLSAPAGDMNCTGFSSTSTPFDADLGTFPTSWAEPGVDGKASGTAWSNGDAVDYRFTITQKDDSTANAHTSATSSGLHTFTWEARSN